MKVTLDTNVLISATFWYGDSNKIIERVERKEIEMVLSGEIIEEFAKVLEYKDIKEKVKGINIEMNWAIEEIFSLSTIVYPNEKLDVVKDDPDDNKVLECAKAGNVDFIVTSDNHLLKLKDFEGIRIMTPKEFMTMI